MEYSEMSEFEQQAVDFLKESGATMKIEFKRTRMGFPGEDPEDPKTMPHREYKVTIERNGMSYSFDFYGSYHQYRQKEDPTEYDVLACLEKYDVGSMADFVDEFGYVIKDRKSFLTVEKIWQSCKSQYRTLKKMFGEELMEKLCEIN